MTEAFSALMVEDVEGKPRAGFREITKKDLPDHDVLVEVSYSSLNYKDGLAVSGKGRIARRLPMVAVRGARLTVGRAPRGRSLERSDPGSRDERVEREAIVREAREARVDVQTQAATEELLDPPEGLAAAVHVRLRQRENEPILGRPVTHDIALAHDVAEDPGGQQRYDLRKARLESGAVDRAGGPVLLLRCFRDRRRGQHDDRQRMIVPSSAVQLGGQAVHGVGHRGKHGGKVGTGRAREVHPLMWALVPLFVAFFASDWLSANVF